MLNQRSLLLLLFRWQEREKKNPQGQREKKRDLKKDEISIAMERTDGEVKIEKVKERKLGAGAQVVCVCSLEDDSIATEPGASPLGGSKTSCVHIEKCREGKKKGGEERVR